MVDFGGVKAIVFFPSDAQELVFFWTCASFRPLSVSPLANSTWECPAGLGSGTKLRHRGGQMWWLQPVLKEWQRRTLVLRLALWLSETQGTSGDRPPSGICHWISLTPWWETQRLYNVCLPLSLSLFASMTWHDTKPSLLSCSSTTLFVLTPRLSPYFSVWSEDRRESAVGLCTESC